MRYHFITGLPRSGSTLLSALLLQNPRFHAGMTSPVVSSLFKSMINQLSAGSEFGPVVSKEQRRRLVRGLFDSYTQTKPRRARAQCSTPTACGAPTCPCS